MLVLPRTRFFFLLLIVGISIGVNFTAPKTTASSARQGQSLEKQKLLERQIGGVPEMIQTARYIGSLQPDDRLMLIISFDIGNEEELRKLLDSQQDINSQDYHKWITPQEFGERFGRSKEELEMASEWLNGQGFKIEQSWPDRLNISFSGTVDVVQQAFQVSLGRYFDEQHNREFYSNQQPPTLPAALKAFTLSLKGLNNAYLFQYASRPSMSSSDRLQSQSGSSPSKGKKFKPNGVLPNGTHFMAPNDLRAAYNVSPLSASGFLGQGQRAGIVIDSDVFNSDVSAYRSMFALPGATLLRRLPPGYTNPGVKVGTDSEGEALLDIDSISAFAPAAEINLILIPDLSPANITNAELYAINTLGLRILNESFGACENTFYNSAERNLFLQAAAVGTAIFVSTGDEGVECSTQLPGLAAIECPACYEGATSVGGTEIQAVFDVNGNLAQIISENVWNDPPGVRLNCFNQPTGGGATGGGFSQIIPKPNYQIGATGFTGGVPAINARFVPDTALLAGSVRTLIIVEGQPVPGGGTSQSSPLWAGIMALINQYKGANQGSPNSELYRLGKAQYRDNTAQVFFDITVGNNSTGPRSPCVPFGVTGFASSYGYDPVTGWGAPDVTALAQKFGVSTVINHPPFDYDGDGKSDLAIWRPSTGSWIVFNSSNNTTTTRAWGISTDLIVPADYDGDGKSDLAVWRPSTGTWFIINSSNNSTRIVGWGINGDIPVPADYDGDGKTDIAVWRPSTGAWFIINSSTNSTRIVGWGLTTDKPVPGDYDGDGKTDIAVWRPSTGVWYIINSSNNSVTSVGWGISTDKLAPADFDGDGRTDIAVWRPSTGVWYIRNSSNGSVAVVGWGVSTDKPVPSSYDGDGRADISVWRPSSGTWFIINSSSGSTRTQSFGINGDIPVPSAFVR